MSRRAMLWVAAPVAISLGLATGSVAMPLQNPGYGTPGVDERGRLAIREIPDDSTPMEQRLSQQLMVLQNQIDRLNAEIQALKAAQQEGQQ